MDMFGSLYRHCLHFVFDSWLDIRRFPFLKEDYRPLRNRSIDRFLTVSRKSVSSYVEPPAFGNVGCVDWGWTRASQ